jgi:hypothetical protein
LVITLGTIDANSSFSTSTTSPVPLFKEANDHKTLRVDLFNRYASHFRFIDGYWEGDQGNPLCSRASRIRQSY